MIDAHTADTIALWGIVASTAIYLVIAVAFAVAGKNGLALAYLCYALANVGLGLAAKGI